MLGEAAPKPAPAPAIDPEELYTGALKAIGQLFQAAAQMHGSTTAPLPMGDLQTVARQIAATIEDDGLVSRAVGPYKTDVMRFVLPHSLNVAILAVRVAREMGMSQQELEVLALAALVHDVGTVRIPEKIFSKPDSLSGEEWEVMRQRPVHSRDILATLGGSFRAIAEIAHQVHERLDGSGYPNQLTVEHISIEASIIGAVDVFEAFIHPRPYKKTVPAAAMYGVDNLMRLSHQFGDGVLKSLVRSVGLFPVGTFVRLNSGEVAEVRSSRPGNPMRPTVWVRFDVQGRRVKASKEVDLMRSPHLYVFRPLSTEDLREMGLLEAAMGVQADA